jgi:hypothetical protein
MKIFLKLFVIVFLFSLQGNAASVRSASQITQLDFGLIGSGDSLGTIGILSGSGICSATTGGVVSFGSCADGSFTLLVRNGGGGVALNNGKQKFRVLLSEFVTTITANDTEILFPSISGCVAASSPSPPAGYVAIDCENTSTANSAEQTWTIPVIAKISNISTAQIGATHNPTYSFVACRCNKGCPTSIGHNKCTITNRGVTLTPTLSAQIYKSLSITSQTDLDFGKIAAGNAPSTFRQTGNALGGNAAQIEEGSAGTFTINGESGGGINYNLTIPASVSLVCPSCGGAPMNVNLEFYSGATLLSSGTVLRALDGSGDDVIDVEGILSVGANQLEGSYSETYPITINY